MSQIHELTTANRLKLADLLESLDEQQWRTPTLCAGWTCQEMAAHLVQPSITSFARVFLVAMRFRGDTDRTVDHITRRIARRPRAELISLLREHAHDRLNPPRVGPMGPYVDTCIHLRDIARPLGLDATVEAHQWQLVLDYLTSPGAAPALFGVRSLEGLTLHATDLQHTWGPAGGKAVRGTGEALAMAITGRRHALRDLQGPGAAVLAQRIS